MNILLELFWVCFKISFLTYGGGHVIFLMFRTEMAKKRHWVSDEDLLDMYSTGLTLPGIVAVNVAAFIGYNVKGVAGCIVAALGIILPSIVVVSVIALFLGEFMHAPFVVSALAGIKIAVTAVLANFVLDLAKKNLRSIEAGAIFALALALLFIWNIHIILVVLLSGALGVVLSRRRLAK